MESKQRAADEAAAAKAIEALGGQVEIDREQADKPVVGGSRTRMSRS